MPHDITIQAPDNVELHIFPNGDFYSWTILNDGEHRLQNIRLLIDRVQSFNSRRLLFRDADDFNLSWTIAMLKPGNETDPVTLLRFEGENLGFGNEVGTLFLPWPTGDHSPIRCWRLNVLVLGLSEQRRIELYLRWTVGAKELEVMQFSGVDSARKLLNTAQSIPYDASMAFRPLKTFFSTADDLLALDLPRLGEIVLVYAFSYERGVKQNGLVNPIYLEGALNNRNMYLGLPLLNEPEYGVRQPEVTRAAMEAWNWIVQNGLVIEDSVKRGWYGISRLGEALLARYARLMPHTGPNRLDARPKASDAGQMKAERGQRLAVAQERWQQIAKRKIPFSWIHAAAGVDHKDAYNWKGGKLPDTSSMSQNIERVLREPNPPSGPITD